jgi:hypothetical protein
MLKKLKLQQLINGIKIAQAFAWAVLGIREEGFRRR